jgi:hypothetical protein
VNVTGVDSVTLAVAGVTEPLAHSSDTVTEAPLSGTKFLLTVKLAVFAVLTIVQVAVPPGVRETLTQAAWLAVYPPGTASVAVQVAPVLKPEIVKDAGVASDALDDTGEAVPLLHVTLTETDAALFGTKSLLTVNVAWLRVLTMVHEAAERSAVQVPLEEYPFGTGDSVAVQFGSPVYPLTVNDAGEVSVALADAGDAVPLVHVTLTVTEAPLLGTKSFATLNVVWLSVLTIVQVPVVRLAEQVPVEE